MGNEYNHLAILRVWLYFASRKPENNLRRYSFGFVDIQDGCRQLLRLP
jgi:hypothetical protein